MFRNKTIAALLLVFYGIPAFVGPHWHHHHDSHCDHLHEAAEQPLAASDHSCDCHPHGHSQNSHAPQPDTPLEHSALVQTAPPNTYAVSSADCHGPCSICHFYSLSQLVAIDSPVIDEQQPVTLFTCESVSPGTPAYLAETARGPPTRTAFL